MQFIVVKDESFAKYKFLTVGTIKESKRQNISGIV
jgi:hypothetical protein